MDSRPFYKKIISMWSSRQLLDKLTKEEIKQFKDKQNLDLYNKLHLVSIVFILIQSFFIISDLITNLYSQKYTYLNLSAELLILISSLIVLVILLTKKRFVIDNIQTIGMIYYLLLETGIIIYLSSDILRGYENSLNFFYNLLFIAIFTLDTFKKLAILNLYVVVGSLTVITCFSQNLSYLSYQHVVILLVFLFFCMNIFRANNIKVLISQVKLESTATQLEQLASVDFLTKLSNRTALSKFKKTAVVNAANEQKNICVIMLDIDDFKAYNDYYSHIKGDNCLRTIGKLLKELENEKFKIFRYGGEEFIIVGIDVTDQDIISYTNIISEQINNLKIKREDLNSKISYVTVSMGCAIGIANQDGNLLDLLKQSDEELYKAKRNGKNCVYFKGKKYTTNCKISSIGE